MVAPYPLIDPRRAKKLVAELERLAAVFVPGLRGITTEDSPGRAIVEIAGRLAGQVTQRLDKIPRRDAIAFFDTLDVPQVAPRSARAPLIFTLSDKRDKPVHALARIQVAASTPDGEEVIFETSSALNLTPARLDYLAAVDTKEDRIEEPPPQFLQLAPAEPRIAYQVETLADAGSDTLQISPAIGLEPGDVIRIKDQVYRVKEAKAGLVTLVEQDRLERAVEADTAVQKVTRFDAFQLRNLQRHLFYIGHAELLNLEQKSTIRLGILPPAAASRLVNLGLAIKIYGTKQSEEQPGWHQFKEENIIARAGEILLYKDWQGSVDEVEIHQQKNRWLKIELEQSINDAQPTDTRIAGFALRVESAKDEPSSASGKSGWCDATRDSGGEELPSSQDNTCISCTVGDQEGSQTIKQAFHNANPLPLSTRFLPFGPEPLRFDSFALAAPEALSKKGAKVALAINLVDATPAAITMALSSSQTRRGYAIGVNGKLQVFELKTGELENWKELGFPEKPPEGRGSDNIAMLRLDHAQAPRAAEIAQEKYVVVVRDMGHRHWVANLSKTTQGNEIWEIISSLPDQATMTDFVLIPKLLSPKNQPQGAALFAVSDKGLYQLNIQSSGVPDNSWKALSNSCDLREKIADNEDKRKEFISQFKNEFKLKKQICAVLIVEENIDAATDTTQWVIAGFDDKGEWEEGQINDPNDPLVEELKKAKPDRSTSKIIELAARIIHRSVPSEKSFTFDEQSVPKPRLVPVHSPDWPAPPVANSLSLVLLDVNGKLWLGKLTWENKRKEWNSAIDWRLLSNENDEWLASTEVRPVAANFGDDRLAIFAAKKDRTLFGLTAPVSDPNGLNPKDLEDIPLPEGSSSFIVQAQTEILCDPGYVDSSTTQPFALAFGETEVTSPVIALWEHDEFKRIPYPAVYGSLKPSGLLAPMPGNKPKPPVIFINGPREKIYRRVLAHEDPVKVKFALFDTVISTSGVEFGYFELIGGDDLVIRIVDLRSALAIHKDNLRAYALSRSEGELSIGQKYNLYRMTSDTFTGEVIVEDDDEGQDVTPSLSGDNSSKQLKLDSADSVTTEKSILTIDSLLYRVTEITEIDGYRVATLDASLAVGVIEYTSSQLLTDEPEKVQGNQIATLLKLTEQTEEPSVSLTKIQFEEGADPLTQSISQRDKQPPDFDNVWLLLEEPWTTIPTDNSATMLSPLLVGDWSEESLANTEKNPELSWEYYNGDGWRRLDEGFNDTTNHLAASGKICFCVPSDITPTEISGQEDYWIRARLVGGDYGRAKYVVTTENTNNSKITTQSITVDTTELRAPEILAIEACFEMTGTVAPQLVLTENNRAVVDQTQANSATSAQFELFQGAAAIDAKLESEEQGRALYLGFTKPYNVNPLTLFIDADEPDDPGDQLETFELLFEVLALEQRWRKVAADDRTGGFQHRGVVKLFIGIIPQRARLFGRDLFWLRVRPGKNGDRWKPLLNGMYINAGETEQARSVKQEILGSSIGEPDQRFFLSKIPVISNSLELRVRETLSEDERLELEQAAEERRDSRQPEFDRAAKPVITTYPDIPGRWVLWQQVDSFVGQDGDARVYQVDPATGEVRFGNDKQGKIPPAGQDVVRAIEYQNGGGEQGNVAAFTIEGLKSSVESVDSVTNPIPATGGVDALAVDTLITTAPDRLRHRQQALTTVDIEALSVAWSSEIVRARCLTPDEPTDPIKVFIARRTGERCPKASLAERDALARYLREQGWGALGERSIRVFNPDYVHLSVTVEILAESPETVAAVEKEGRERILTLLHPIDGGSDGSGWPFGHGLWKSDLFRALANVPGLDRVDNIELEPKSLDNLPPSSLICADEEKVKVKVGSESVESPS